MIVFQQVLRLYCGAIKKEKPRLAPHQNITKPTRGPQGVPTQPLQDISLLAGEALANQERVFCYYALENPQYGIRAIGRRIYERECLVRHA